MFMKASGIVELGLGDEFSLHITKVHYEVNTYAEIVEQIKARAHKFAEAIEDEESRVRL